MGILDISGDAQRAFSALQKGGIAIFPVDVGYTIAGGSQESLLRIFNTKGRQATKLNAMVGDMEIHRSVHLLGQRERDMVSTLTEDYDLPLGVIAPYDKKHPMIGRLDPASLAGSSREDTIAMLVNAGPFHAEICRLSRDFWVIGQPDEYRHEVPCPGYSAAIARDCRCRGRLWPSQVLPLSALGHAHQLRDDGCYSRRLML